MSYNLAVIIAAGGRGDRFGSKFPKQFADIEGTPMIIRSMKAFGGIASYFAVSLIPEYIDYFNNIITEELRGMTKVVSGGSNRFESVRNALSVVPNSVDYIAVHDAARPFVSRDVIISALDIAQKHGASVPSLPLVDSIRRVYDDGTTESRVRSNYVAVQTPQIFRADILRRSYKLPYSPDFTDDASVVESAGYKVFSSKGDISNIKITYSQDIL